MPKIEITRTELVWPGKHDEDSNLVQVERFNLPAFDTLLLLG